MLILLVGVSIYLLMSSPKLPPETDAIIDSVLHSDLSHVIRGETGFVASDGLKIWYESVAPVGVPQGVVLLIMAMAGNALDWDPKFIRTFVESGYQVIRYDNRGTGMSDWMEQWTRKNPYSIADMAGDAVAVLDALNVQTAHIVGLSMGGMIAQEVAIHDPERVASLTLMMTSGNVADPDLPGLTSRYLLTSFVKGVPLFKYRIMGGEKNLIKERIAKIIMFVGGDDLDIREIAETVLYDLRERRGINLKAIFQHQAAVAISGSRYDGLRSLDIPTLVIHGTADQFIPVEHGKKLAAVIPNAQGLWLEGVGHIFPFPDMDAIQQRILLNFGDAP
jgi:pimeloyl-ACP methyl ester carboxylesterase